MLSIFGKISKLLIERIHNEMGQKFKKTYIWHCRNSLLPRAPYNFNAREGRVACQLLTTKLHSVYNVYEDSKLSALCFAD